jgi:hypothetical protein
MKKPAATQDDYRTWKAHALKAGYRWVDVYCAGCRQVKSIDSPPSTSIRKPA